jgi:hypothetical protein
MSRQIPNKPHPTPDPEKSHGAARTDRGSRARSIHGVPGPSEHLADQRSDPESEEPSYDSCFDDLNMVLSQSMEQPDPDPNLESEGERPRQPDGADPESGWFLSPRGKAPRTSEIFRAVVGPPGGDPRPPTESSTPGVQDKAAGEAAMPDLGVVERRTGSTDSHVAGDRYQEGHIPWGQIVLLSYASVLTLALIWLLGTGRVPRAAAPEPSAAEKSTAEPALLPAQPDPDTPPPPLPPENITTLGKSIRLGDLEVTPLSVEAKPVELVHTIRSKARRREADCLVLRLRLKNLSKDQTYPPVDRKLVREHDVKAYDPFIQTSDGESLRLFPLALDSEWSIFGQVFSPLEPGASMETSVAAEPGSANHLADEMTWRVRLRIGVYRVDMLGVKFTKAEVRRPPVGRGMTKNQRPGG